MLFRSVISILRVPTCFLLLSLFTFLLIDIPVISLKYSPDLQGCCYGAGEGTRTLKTLLLRQVCMPVPSPRLIGTPGWTRTSTEWILSPLPLPLGYRSMFCSFCEELLTPRLIWKVVVKPGHLWHCHCFLKPVGYSRTISKISVMHFLSAFTYPICGKCRTHRRLHRTLHIGAASTSSPYRHPLLPILSPLLK